MDIQKIKEIALANGFSLKEQASGNMDLHSYVYEFANAIEQATKAQAAEKIEALQNAVIFADECRKEWHESYMKLRKDKAVPEGFVLVPKEPTLEMCHRGRNTRSFKVQDIYKAMIEVRQ